MSEAFLTTLGKFYECNRHLKFNDVFVESKLDHYISDMDIKHFNDDRINVYFSDCHSIAYRSGKTTIPLDDRTFVEVDLNMYNRKGKI
jgi:hypothetical protein